MSRLTLLLITLLLASCVAADQGSRRLTRERISLWLHELSRSSVVANNPGQGSSAIRALAIVSGAMFEAANVLERKYEPYMVSWNDIPSSINKNRADVLVAVSFAAEKVLNWLYPGIAAPQPGLPPPQGLPYFHSDLRAILTKGLDDTTAYENGKAVGEFVANAWIANRTSDNHPPINVAVVNGTSCGQYMYNLPFHTGNPFSSGYYTVRPFGVQRFNDSIGPGQLFYVPPPPAIGSPEQLEEWAETFGYGASTPSAVTRTTETNTTAIFHDGFFGSSIQFLSDVFTGDNVPGNIDGVDALRIVAVAAMSSHDAHTIHWQWKYTYLRWRPIAAYHLADLCSSVSPAVAALDDNSWNPILLTGQNPEYPSGHSSRTGGFVGVFRRLLYNNLQFTTLSFGLPGVERSYNSFQEFEQEVNNARVWGGVHWRSACNQGLALGERVAANYVSRLMRPRNN
jgi:hypothetical protein